MSISMIVLFNLLQNYSTYLTRPMPFTRTDAISSGVGLYRPFRPQPAQNSTPLIDEYDNFANDALMPAQQDELLRSVALWRGVVENRV